MSAPPMQGGNLQTREILEMEQTMVKEIRQQNLDGALTAANAVLEQSPSNKRAQEFSQVLQELIAAREEDSDSSSEESDSGAEDPEGRNNQAGAINGGGRERTSGNESSSEERSEESSSEEEEEEEEEEEITQGQQAGMSKQGQSQALSSVDAAATQLSSLSLDKSNLRMTHESRRQLRESLAGSVRALRDKQHMQDIVEGDPLLGA